MNRRGSINARGIPLSVPSRHLGDDRDIDPARFVWADEIGSDLGMTRSYGRAPRGQRTQATVPGKRGANRTLITTLTVDGFGPGLLLDEAIDRATGRTPPDRAPDAYSEYHSEPKHDVGRPLGDRSTT